MSARAAPGAAAPRAAAGETPRCAFIGWGPDSAAVLEALRGRYADIDAHALALAGWAGAVGTASAADPAAGAPRLRTLPTVEGLFQAAEWIFAEGGAEALEPQLAMIRLAISDRHALVLLGGGWSLTALLEPLKERKLARCMLLPTSPGRLGALAFHTSPYFAPEERARLRAMFAHLEPVVELREEHQFEVLRGLADFAPAVFYTVLEALADGVVMMGFSRAAALQVLASLLHGAAQRVLDGENTAAQLREQALEVDVAAAGLIELESAGIRGALMRAVNKSVRRPRTATLPTQEDRD